jgi:hypothetical protein
MQFDADGSGALDAGELTILFNQNGIAVDEEDIKRLFGSANISMTFEKFERYCQDKAFLRNFRQQLKPMMHKLRDTRVNDEYRHYIPTTFDGIMLDFGHKLQKRQIYNRI